MIAAWGEINAFAVLCEVSDLTPPKSITAARNLTDVAREYATEPATPLLELSDDEMRSWLEQVTIRRLSGGFTTVSIDDILSREVKQAIGPELEALIEEMRPRFDEIAAPFSAAVNTYGFTARTTSDDVIRMADEGASTAWRETEKFFRQVQPLATVRTSMSRVFDVSPTAHEQGLYSDQGVDYSVCFAAEDAWSDDGRFYLAQHIGGTLDWFALAAGGLRLNSPAEVAAKTHGRFLASIEGD